MKRNGAKKNQHCATLTGSLLILCYVSLKVRRSDRPPVLVSLFIDTLPRRHGEASARGVLPAYGLWGNMSYSFKQIRLEHCWSWHYEKIGILTVRSVHRMLAPTKRRCEDLLESRLGGSNTASEGMQWQQLWKIQVPSKFKYFCGG
jgi:hypothetical protein